MLDKDKFNQMMNEINVKFQDFSWQVKSISIDKLYNSMGFVENYMDIINI